MSGKRFALAAVILLSVLYVKLTTPELFRTAAPAMRSALERETFALPVSDSVLAWLAWD